MDARALAAAAGTQVDTLNVWLHKGYFPGAPEGRPGRGQGRDFDIPTAVRIGLMVELLRLRVRHDFAAELSDPALRGDNKILLLFAHPRERKNTMLREFPFGHFFQSEEKLKEYLKEMRAEMPPTYTVIDIRKIEENMQRAQEEWEKRGDAAAA